MDLLDLLKLSTRMFKTRPMRTLLTILGVGVGIGTVLFLVSLGYGLQNVILSRITTADALLSLDVSAGTSELIDLNNETVEKISNIKNVAEVSPVLNLSAQLTMGDLTGDNLVYAVKPSFFRLEGIAAKYGEFFNTEYSYEAVISTAGVELFNIDPEKMIGKKLALTLFVPRITEDETEEVDIITGDEKYVIKGIIEDESANYIYIPINTIADLEIDKYSVIKVKVSEDEFIEEVRNEIIGQGFLVSALSDTIDQTKKIFRIIQIILALFGFVALTVSAIGMFNTMTIALLERINEIGIMRAVGASKKDIRRMFLIESMLMGLLGGIGGILIGYLAGETANFGLNILAKNFGGQAMDLFYYPPWFIAITIIFSAIIGFLTGVYPSVRASRLNPLDALRYK